MSRPLRGVASILTGPHFVMMLRLATCKIGTLRGSVKMSQPLRGVANILTGSPRRSVPSLSRPKSITRRDNEPTPTGGG